MSPLQQERPRFPKGRSQRESLEVADRIPLGGATPGGIKSGIRGGVKGGTRKMYTARRRESQIIHSSEGEEDEESNDSDAGEEEEEDDKEVEAGTSTSAEGSESRKGDGPEGGKAEEEEDEDDEDEEEKEDEEDEEEEESESKGCPAVSSRWSSGGQRGRGGRTPNTPVQKGRNASGGDVRRRARKK